MACHELAEWLLRDRQRLEKQNVFPMTVHFHLTHHTSCLDTDADAIRTSDTFHTLAINHLF